MKREGERERAREREREGRKRESESERGGRRVTNIKEHKRTPVVKQGGGWGRQQEGFQTFVRLPKSLKVKVELLINNSNVS